MTGRLVDLTFSINRKQRITVEVDDDFRGQFDKLKDCPIDIEIKKHRKKRSLNANAYMWVMLQELADKLETTKEELYRHKIQQYGIFQDFTLDESNVKTFCHTWEAMGTGWITEKVDFADDGERYIIRAYYGSSCYNSKQMSRLINAVVDDCKAQGIETLSERMLSLLVDAWKGGIP